MEKIVGECLHLVNSFVCSCGVHQNYPCPYRPNFEKCKASIIITEEMKEQWETKGCIVIHVKN